MYADGAGGERARGDYSGIVSAFNVGFFKPLFCAFCAFCGYSVRPTSGLKTRMRVSAETQTSFAGAVNAEAFFLTNSWTLIGACPVNVSTSSDIRS